jgi:MurNAc alpha-1-phosphate uridylyltransferase
MSKIASTSSGHTEPPALQIKTAMVLAAGLGTRMRPLSLKTPKPLIEVNGKALLDHMLDKLEADGVQTAVVNVHYLADMIEQHLKARQESGKGPRIIVCDEREALLETGGALVKARPHLGDEPVFVVNTDQVWIEGANFTLKALRAAWRPEQMDALLMLASTVTALGYEGRGDFDMDTLGKLTRRGPGSITPFVFAGVHILKPTLLDGRVVEAFSTNRIWDELLENERLFGRRFDGRWMHVGDPKARLEAERVLRVEQAP